MLESAPQGSLADPAPKEIGAATTKPGSYVLWPGAVTALPDRDAFRGEGAGKGVGVSLQ